MSIGAPQAVPSGSTTMPYLVVGSWSEDKPELLQLIKTPANDSKPAPSLINCPLTNCRTFRLDPVWW